MSSVCCSSSAFLLPSVLLQLATIVNLANVVPLVNAAIPTAYLDIRRTNSRPPGTSGSVFSDSTGMIETNYLYRIMASESKFAPGPPMASKEATEHPLSYSHDGSGGATGGQLNTGSGSGYRHGFPSYTLTTPPESDTYLCSESKGLVDYSNPMGNTALFGSDGKLPPLLNKYVLVARGGCSFEAKARSAQRLGAKGVIIRNTLESRYELVEEADYGSNYEGGNGTATNDGSKPNWSTTIWPTSQKDYECGDNHGIAYGKPFGMRAEILTSKLNFEPPPYDAHHNDVLLTGTAAEGNLCAIGAMDTSPEEFSTKCPSQRCLLTGNNGTYSQDGSVLEACCAWDTHIIMSSDGDDTDAIPNNEEESITIPVLFLTMSFGDDLYDLVVDAHANSMGVNDGSVQFISVVPYARYYPEFHYSTVVLWIMAVFALGVSCYMSASEYRKSWKVIGAAVGEGVVVFQRRSAGNANGHGRARADTEDTVDLAEDLDMEVTDATAGEGDDLALQVEMTEQNSNLNPDTNNDNFSNGEESANKVHDGQILPNRESSDDYIDNEPSSAEEEGGMVNEETAVPANNESLDSNGPTDNSEEAQTPPSADPPTSQTQESQTNQQSRQNNQQQVLQLHQTTDADIQHMELNAFHAVIFVACASSMLFILFYFNLYKVITVLYGIGGSTCMAQIIFRPCYNWTFAKCGCSKRCHSNACGNFICCRGVYFQWIDILAYTSAFIIGIAWIDIGLYRYDPLASTYYWIVQNIMGICYCILILGLIHINTIMVATILLVLVFFYDIFYVFITPYIFGTSVMVDVATGNSADADFCTKYPEDSTCRGSQAPLPMLLVWPWTDDYRGGQSMIGLGDIVLPGLLVSFAARLDCAKELVKKCSRTMAQASSTGASGREAGQAGTGLDEGIIGATASNSESTNCCSKITRTLFHGYFGPLMISYAVGLLAAYIAVWGMQKGQPALLYIVPACLGTTLFLGWEKKELSELWVGPKVMRKANRLVAIANGIPELRIRAASSANSNLAETTSIA